MARCPFVTNRMKSRELISSSMEVMLVSRVDTKVVSSVLVAVLMLVTERVTEVMETTSDSIEVDVVDSSTASVNILEVWVNALSYWKLSTSNTYCDPLDESDLIDRFCTSTTTTSARSGQN